MYEAKRKIQENIKNKVIVSNGRDLGFSKAMDSCFDTTNLNRAA